MPTCLKCFLIVAAIAAEGFHGLASAGEFKPPRCEIVPLADSEVSLRIDGIEKTRWNFGSQYPRPFLFPFYGPSGASLTRMGHPGAPNHDHHRSIWFAHHSIDENDF
ncbi:MAG: PmoA family protein, partial [Planctomycetales bacterium]|nr:PmoA family protein [Planctomycetales bacterium]